MSCSRLSNLVVVGLCVLFGNNRAWADSSVVWNVTSEIVGGTPAGPRDFPFYVVSVGDVLCGGSLIHRDMVLTAAHCGSAFRSAVRIGPLTIHAAEPSGMLRSVKNLIWRPTWGPDTEDILLVQLNEAVPEGYSTLRWSSASSSLRDGEMLTVMGFGWTTEDGDLSPILRRVDVPVVEDSICNARYLDMNTRNFFCAGEQGKDSCQGDSGSPIINRNGVQVGIVSSGYGCGRDGFPGVYTRLSTFSDWIASSICEHSAFPPSSCASARPTDNCRRNCGRPK